LLHRGVDLERELKQGIHSPFLMAYGNAAFSVRFLGFVIFKFVIVSK
jgi:hypothetical protein